MSEDEKTSYPIMPVKHWWALRNKFRQSIPTNVTPGFLAAALGMKEDSAKGNILPFLKIFKIIDQDGKPTERARRWRDDEQYPAVCEEIRKEIYPEELIEALPPPSPNRVGVERWFSNRTGVGVKAAKKMALVYLLLCEANPAGGQELTPSLPSKPTQRKTKQVGTKTEANPQAKAATDSKPDTKAVKPSFAVSPIVPSFHIDIQIHISPDASATQIDQIFASMATHLGKLMKHDE